MRKCFTLIILLTVVSSIYAQNYQIKFSGTGESNNVTQVKIENLTQQTNLTINGTDILLLKKYLTGVDEIKQSEKGNLTIFPNPVSDYTYLKFTLSERGNTFIEISDISGRYIKKYSEFLNYGIHTYRLEGLETGIYLVKVYSNKFLGSAKLISIKEKKGISSHILSLKNISFQPVEALKSTAANVEMRYNEGDRLKFTGISGKHKTVVMDTPSSNKTISFEFISCIDPDGKGYEIVKIGNQWWMAENLSYLPSVYPASQSSYTEPRYFVYKYDGSDIKEAKDYYRGHNYYELYGVLYNWPSANCSCPQGWHLPSDSEWEKLALYLDETRGPFSKYFNNFNDYWNTIGSYLKAGFGWDEMNNIDGNGNDEFGLNMLPGGHRNSYSSFNNEGQLGFWWSSTKTNSSQSWSRILHIDPKFERKNWHHIDGYSVRCIKD